MKLYELLRSLLLGCILSLIILTECKAQHVNLSTQAEVNAFGATNPTTVVGNLIIQESVPGNITDLTPLSTLTSVGGYLQIYNITTLTSLTGLDALTSIGGKLQISFINALTSLVGLEALTSVGGILQISNNAALTNLAGLDALTSHSGDISITNNTVLTSLAGLDALTSVSGNLIITDNAGLINLAGLDALTSVGGYLYIRFNYALTSLAGIDALTSVGGFLYIFGNSELAEFCPLFTLLTSAVGGLTGTYTVSGNAVNPTKQQIIDGGACVPLPVELTTFTATLTSSEAGSLFVNLNWATSTEVDNFGFEVERTIPSIHNWQKIGFVHGYGNSNSPKEYSFIDKSLIGGTEFKYRLKQLDNDGKFKYSDIVEVKYFPTEFAVSQNYPNPFNPVTKIRYSIPQNVKSETSEVILKIYDVLGNEVATLVDNYRAAGSYEVEFDASTLSSGVYYYKLAAGNFSSTKKMILLR